MIKKIIEFLKGQLFNMIFCVILVVSVIGAYYMVEKTKVELNVFLLFVVFQFLFLYCMIDYFYQRPISNLVYNIKKAIFTKDEINFKKSINTNINYTNKFFSQIFQGFRGIKDELFKGKVIKGEVELAKDIQEKLLNKKLVIPESLNIVAKSKPLGEIGGDSFDTIQNGNNYYIYVGDATGHGVGAGFIMVMVNALIEAFTKKFVSGADVLVLTNEVLKPRIKANLLMSLLLIRWNEEEKRLFMTGAGHEYLIIYKHSQKKCYKVKSGGVALGMVKNIQNATKEVEIKVEENDIIVLYSDGITESINSNDTNKEKDRFGETRMIKAIEQAKEVEGKDYKTAQSVFNSITVELSKFMWYKPKQLDDMTLLVMHYKGKDYNPETEFDDKILYDKETITEWTW